MQKSLEKKPSSEFQKKRMYIINCFVKEWLLKPNSMSKLIELDISFRFTFDNYFSLHDIDKIKFYEYIFNEKEKKQHNEKIKQILINN